MNGESKKCGRKRQCYNFVLLTFDCCTVPSLYFPRFELFSRKERKRGGSGGANVQGLLRHAQFFNLLNYSFHCSTSILFPMGLSAQIHALRISWAFPLFLYSAWVYWNKFTELLIVLCTNHCQNHKKTLRKQE